MAPKAPRHICPHCGAVYKVNESSRPCRRTYRTAVCSYCGDVMAAWVGCARHYHRTGRPSPSTRAMRIVAEAAPGPARKRKLKRAR